jgi:hypothetical protein
VKERALASVDFGKGGEVDAATGFDRYDPERHAEMDFPRARRSNEMDGFGAVDELQFGQRHDPALVERGLEGKVEAGEGLDGGEARPFESPS